MYNDHFGLSRSPFKITPDTELFYTGGGRGEILDALVYAITSGEGIIKVTGEVGTGKTMLCRMLEDRLPENVDLVYLANPSLTPDDIVHAIALELGVLPGAAGTRIEMVFQLQQILVQRHAQDHRVVVLVEEAQSMPTETLEEVRLLSNLETQREKLLQIVLFGQPELDEKLASPDIRQLRERITHSFQLSPLRPQEIGDYVNFRLRAAGFRGRDAFSANAVKVMSRASEGLTRRVNILADKALLAAYAEDTHDVERRHVTVAIKDSAFQRVRKGKVFSMAALLLVASAAAGVGWFGARMLSGYPPASMMNADATEPAGALAAGARAVDALIGTSLAEREGTEAAAATPAPAGLAGPLAARRDGAAGNASGVGKVLPPVHDSGPQAIAAAPAEAAAPRQPAAGERPLSGALPEVPPEAAPAGATPGDRLQAVAAGGAQAPDAGSSPGTPPRETPEPLERTLVAALGEGDSRLIAPPPVAPAAIPAAPASNPEPAPAPAVAAVPTPASAPAPAPLPTPPPQAQPVRAAADPVPVKAVDSPAPSPVEAPPGDLLEQRLRVTEQWLDGINPRHFTIQLLATVATERRSVLEFLDRQRQRDGIGSVFIYETTIGGRPWYSVVFGDFSSFSEAKRALGGLPRDLQRHGPFIRNLRDLRARG